MLITKSRRPTFTDFRRFSDPGPIATYRDPRATWHTWHIGRRPSTRHRAGSAIGHGPWPRRASRKPSWVDPSGSCARSGLGAARCRNRVLACHNDRTKKGPERSTPERRSARRRWSRSLPTRVVGSTHRGTATGWREMTKSHVILLRRPWPPAKPFEVIRGAGLYETPPDNPQEWKLSQGSGDENSTEARPNEWRASMVVSLIERTGRG